MRGNERPNRDENERDGGNEAVRREHRTNMITSLRAMFGTHICQAREEIMQSSCIESATPHIK